MARARGTEVEVGIIGAGPAGLLLGRLLERAGVSFVIVERQSRDHVESRIRAGVLEQGTAKLLDRAGVGARMRREGLVHEGVELIGGGRRLRVDFRALTGSAVTVYGQTEITRDLNQAHADAGAQVLYQCDHVRLEGLTGPRARLRCRHQGQDVDFACAFIAGCDGYHGVSRASIPREVLREYERVYPFGWLGVLSDTPPIAGELIYAQHERGFALCSMRSPRRSRYYVQVGAGEALADWPDDRFWDELRQRLPPQLAAGLITGASIEKSIAPLRSFVAEPMRHGNLFLAGDAAHIVPPTGAKGLNLALADVAALADGFIDYFHTGRSCKLDAYSDTRLTRVWQAERFSWWLTALTHQLSPDPFGARLQRAEFDYLSRSRAARTAFAENYAGLAPSA